MLRMRLGSTFLAILSILLTGQVAKSQSTIVGFDFSALPGGANNYGPSPFAPTTIGSNVTSSGLVRGAGVGLTNSGAARGLGGNNFTSTNVVDAITSEKFFTLTITPTANTTVSYSAVSQFDYRRSGTGPTIGVLQYAVGNGSFTDAATVNYSSNANAGSTIAPINLAGIAALQNVTADVTFRVVNYGGTTENGTFYFYDTGVDTGVDDLVFTGTVTPVPEPTTIFGLSAAGLGALRWVRRRVIG